MFEKSEFNIIGFGVELERPDVTFCYVFTGLYNYFHRRMSV